MGNIFVKGDMVRIKHDWRLWKKGDIATVKDYLFNDGSVVGQVLKLEAESNKKAERDADIMYAYNVEPIYELDEVLYAIDAILEEVERCADDCHNSQNWDEVSDPRTGETYWDRIKARIDEAKKKIN